MNFISAFYFMTGVVFVILSMFTSTVYASWHYGIGGGISQYDADTEISLSDRNLSPLTFNADLEPDDLSELAQGLIQFNGYGSNGKRRFNYGLKVYKISELDSSNQLYDFEQESTNIYYSMGNAIYHGDMGRTLYLTYGAHYQKIKFNSKKKLVESEEPSERLKSDASWLDISLGLKADIPISEAIVIHASVEALGGKSEGGYVASLGMNYRLSKDWTLVASGQKQDIEFKEGKVGKADYLVLDTEVTSISVNFIRIW